MRPADVGFINPTNKGKGKATLENASRFYFPPQPRRTLAPDVALHYVDDLYFCFAGAAATHANASSTFLESNTINSPRRLVFVIHCTASCT